MRLINWTAFLFVLWMVLTSTLGFANILIGLVVSYAIALLYVKMFPENKALNVSVKAVFEYIYILLKNLVESNIQINKIILSKKMKISAAVVAVETELDSDWKKLLLANSITLTPGTLTLDIIGNTLYIHTLQYDSSVDRKEIIREFEEAIAKI